jgi:hypothetical protein
MVVRTMWPPGWGRWGRDTECEREGGLTLVKEVRRRRKRGGTDSGEGGEEAEEERGD